MYPFRKNATQYWNSNDIIDWTTLGYAIPGNKKLDEADRQKLATHLHEYYNWLVNPPKKSQSTNKTSRTTVGSSPPASVSKDWPRDLSKSIALNGNAAIKTVNPVISFQALDKSQLVTRRVTIETKEQPTIKISDQPRDIVIPDIGSEDDATPPETVKSGKMPTWNARVQVKK